LFVATSDGALWGSSVELQLEIPKAANSESTRMVKTIRAGVHNGFSVLSFFACISYLLQPAIIISMKHIIQRL